VTHELRYELQQRKGQPMRKILVADDDRDATDMLARLLRWQKFEVLIAYDGKTAINLARQHLPEALILDLKMPGLNGYHIAEQLRAEPEFQNALFIALSGFADQQHLDEAGRVKFDEYLIKPCKLRRLLDVLGQPAAERARDPIVLA
jgi:CheY-like chemotaxis protein